MLKKYKIADSKLTDDELIAIKNKLYNDVESGYDTIKTLHTSYSDFCEKKTIFYDSHNIQPKSDNGIDLFIGYIRYLSQTKIIDLNKTFDENIMAEDAKLSGALLVDNPTFAYYQQKIYTFYDALSKIKPELRPNQRPLSKYY